MYIQYIHFCYVHVAGLLETTIENMKCLHTKAMVKLEEHSSSKRKVGRDCAECTCILVTNSVGLFNISIRGLMKYLC